MSKHVLAILPSRSARKHREGDADKDLFSAPAVNRAENRGGAVKTEWEKYTLFHDFTMIA